MEETSNSGTASIQPKPIKIEPQRIGGAGFFYALGAVALAIGMIAAAGGGLSAIGVSSFFSSLGTGLIGIGFVISLFGKIERRMMEMMTIMQRDK
ncbi:MAG: hypothetical protein J0I19_06155 [Alphaproteobacteria bacterium]|nr:hypothetical protein [Alphaproteobacteria bacterium]